MNTEKYSIEQINNFVSLYNFIKKYVLNNELVDNWDLNYEFDDHDNIKSFCIEFFDSELNTVEKYTANAFAEKNDIPVTDVISFLMIYSYFSNYLFNVFGDIENIKNYKSWYVLNDEFVIMLPNNKQLSFSKEILTERLNNAK